jgi:hypothetical protein
MWAVWPTGTVKILRRGATQDASPRDVMKGEWKNSCYYDIFFTGTFICWRDINQKKLNIVAATPRGTHAKSGGFLSSLLSSVRT